LRIPGCGSVPDVPDFSTLRLCFITAGDYLIGFPTMHTVRDMALRWAMPPSSPDILTAANTGQTSFRPYVANNPEKVGLVDIKERWRWSSARRKADDKKRSSAPRLALHEM